MDKNNAATWRKVFGNFKRLTKADLIKKLWQYEKSQGLTGQSDRFYEAFINDCLSWGTLIEKDGKVQYDNN